MPDQVQLRGGTANDNDSFTGVSREVTVDTTNKTLRVHDGETAGGSRLAAYDEWGRLQVEDPVNNTDVANKSYVDGVVEESGISFEGSETAAQESTTSTSFTDLATVGPSIEIDVPASGKVLVSLSAFMWGSGAGVVTSMNLAATGTNTYAAGDTWGGLTAQSRSAIGNSWAGSGHGTASRTFLLSGLNPGTTTFTAKYATSSATSTFRNRVITVVAEKM